MVPTPAEYSGINEEFLQSLGGEPLKTIGIEGTLFSPLLLVVAEEECPEKHFVIDKLEECIIDIDSDCKLTQTITGIAHEASEEEIENYLKGEDE